MILLVIGIILWIPAMIVRFLIMVLGWVLVPFHLLGVPWMTWMYGNTDKGSFWKDYVELAWRNPLTGLDSLIPQPLDEERPNPDHLVRTIKDFRAERFMQAGIFWEYWSLSRIMRGPWQGRYWEFRVGWKFVDGNKDFVPTFQLGPKK